jgi:hypothetical protein
MRELDEKKFADSNPAIKNRCRTVVSQLRNLLKFNDCEIRKDVFLRFDPKEPSIDWEEHALSRDIPDDRIIATIIQYYPTAILISADFGCDLKAQAKNIKTIKLPDELMIEIKDKISDENKKLKEQIVVYENKSPLLSIKFQNDNKYENYHSFSVRSINEYDSNQEKIKIDTLKSSLDYLTITEETSYPDRNTLGYLARSLLPSKEDLKNYNNDLDKYIKKMKEYYHLFWEYKERMTHFFEIKLVLVNDGTVPAEDIDISLHFPDGFEMRNKIPIAPSEPNKPQKPKTAYERMNDLQFYMPSLAPRISDYPLPYNVHDNSPTITKTHSYDVDFNILSLKHTFSFELDSLFLFYPDKSSIHPFPFTYSIVAANHPKPFEGTLNIVFKKLGDGEK